MRDWSPQRVADAASARLASAPSGAAAGPERFTIDSRDAGPGALFIGLPGTRVDGGRFAPGALRSGAWGVVVGPEHEEAAREVGHGTVLVHDNPLTALANLGRAWRRALGAHVIGITGSTGKTSTKDITAALLRPARRTVASEANLNTEIGLPLQILRAPAGTEVLVLELAMRGAGQIAELTDICEPDVGVIVNVGPVHLELLGTIENIAAAKAELIAGLQPEGTAVVPAGEPLLAPHLRGDLRTITFGPGGDVRMTAEDGDELMVDLRGREERIRVSFPQPHHRLNLLAALAAVDAVGVQPPEELEVRFGALRGERIELPGNVLVIDDCYNANPMSMRAALDDLAATAAAARSGRRVAVLGDMLELGPREVAFHREIGTHAGAAGVDLLVTVGALAAHMAEGFPGETIPVATAADAAALLPELTREGDTILVKASRGVGLEVVAQSLAAGAEVR